MKNYNVRFLQPALDDLEEIVLFIAKDNIEDALKFHHKMIENAHKLAGFLKLGRLVPNKKISSLGFRVLQISSYIIFYRVIDEGVIIYRVIHGARNYPMLLKHC